jgi:serine/threonine-protein kinase
MAPEQYMGGPIDQRCDIHAAAVVLYELMTGAAPFSGNPAEIMHQVCYESPPALSTVNPQIPPAFDAIVAKALEKNPVNRYASALEFNEALGAISQAISSKAVAPMLAQRPRVTTATMCRVSVATPPANPSPARDASAPAASDAPPATALSTISSTERALRRPPPARTQVTMPDARPPPISATPVTPKQTRPDSSRAHGTLAAWSREQLAEIERQLTQIVGPVAKVLVHTAAANTANRQQLYAMLADHLHTPEERHRFLAGEARTGSKPPGSLSTASAETSGVHVERPLTPEMLERATQLLSRYVGPIAPILTKKAAQTAIDEAQLYSLLAGKLSDPAEKARFMREAQRIASDLLRPPGLK